jgi:hypothetical protein
LLKYGNSVDLLYLIGFKQEYYTARQKKASLLYSFLSGHFNPGKSANSKFFGDRLAF